MSRKKKILPTSTLLFGILLGAALFFGVQKWATQLSAIVTTPVLYAQHTISQSIARINKRRTKITDLKKRLQEVETENALLLEQLVEQTARANVCRSFTQLSSFAERYQLTDAPLVQILLKHITNDSHYFLVGGGSNKKIQKNDIALYHHQLIGKVVEVYPFYSKVQLITDPTSRIAIECASTHTKGIAEGTGNSKELNLTFAVHFSELKDTDLILSLGTGLIFPRGFGIGTAHKEVTKDVFHKATITPLIAIEEIEECLIASRANLEKAPTTEPQTLDKNQEAQKNTASKLPVHQPLSIPRPPTPIHFESLPHQEAASHQAMQTPNVVQTDQTQKKTTEQRADFLAATKTPESGVIVETPRHDTDPRQGEQHRPMDESTIALPD